MRTRIIGILSTEHTEDTDRRKLSTELFFCSLRLEILGEILIKNGRRPEMLWIHGAHGGHGSSEIIHGIILEVASQDVLE